MAEPLPVLAEAPAFRLLSDDGREFSSESLRGRAWLASFLYTSCPGPCPRLVERLKTVRSRVPATDVAFVSFSVDPEHDTPPVLAEYKAKHGISPGDQWTFVTGPSEDVLALVQRGFLTGVGAGEAGGEEGAVSHGTRVALVDAQQKIRGFYSTESDEDLERLVRDARAVE
jgi:protein SCO1